MTDPAPIVILIGCDPRTSHRAFEAMRIGLGIVASEHRVVLVLTGGAVHLLAADTDDLVDGDDVARVRESLRKLHITFHVDAEPAEPRWHVDAHPVVRVTTDEIADLVTRARRVLVF